MASGRSLGCTGTMTAMELLGRLHRYACICVLLIRLTPSCHSPQPLGFVPSSWKALHLCSRLPILDPHLCLSGSVVLQGRPAMMPNWDKDYNAGRTLLTMNGLPVFEAPIHLEGGSIHSDGQGTMVVTEECLLDPSRNPDLGKEGIEQVLPAQCDHVSCSTTRVGEFACTHMPVMYAATFLLPVHQPDLSPGWLQCRQLHVRRAMGAFMILSHHFLMYMRCAGAENLTWLLLVMGVQVLRS